jgi:coenzyme F420 biosynthesis associated uncharacterized protein
MTSDEDAPEDKGRSLLGAAVDWQLAAKAGVLMSRSGPEISRRGAERVVTELSEASTRAEAPVREVTGLADGLPVPPALVVDRPGWITAAAASMAKMTDSDNAEPTRMFAGKPAGVQAGAMLAFLSSAILGQYDPFTGEDGTLLLVAPNIVAVERTLGVRPGDFRLWVCLHEVTHRVQFSAVPWLADYLRDAVATLTESTSEPLSEIFGRLAEELKERRNSGPHDRAGQGGVIGLLRATQGPAQRAALDRILVLGTLLEGHADHVMDAVGPAVVPTVAAIRKTFDERRKRPQNPVQRLLRALLGMDAKLAQYVRGKAFVDAVVERVGMQRFNTVWTDPTTLPLSAEVADPDAWVARVLG